MSLIIGIYKKFVLICVIRGRIRVIRGPIRGLIKIVNLSVKKPKSIL